MDDKEIIKIATNTLLIESEAVKKIASYINDDFVEIVKLISQSKGRVIITGIGKSANIAMKIVASLNSTGTPSIFMHAADAIHGDLGIIQSNDIVICISKSGNTPEIKVLIPLIKSNNNTLIALVSDIDSYLAKSANYILRASVDAEACPNNLAPTSSTTAQLALGDALTVSLLEYKGFSSTDFAKFHPGGSLGKKLYLRVEDIIQMNELPKVYINDNVKTILTEITTKRLGATAVIDNDDKIIGIITDGDIRRMIENYCDNLSEIKAENIMSRNPITIEYNELAANAFQIINQHNISQIIVTKDYKYFGILHAHDLMREGLI